MEISAGLMLLSNEVSLIYLMEMSRTEFNKLLNISTFIGKFATAKKDGSSHVVPHVSSLITLIDKLGNIYLITSSASAKAENIKRNNRISRCVDDQYPPFSFITISDIVKIYPYKKQDVLNWTTDMAIQPLHPLTEYHIR